MQAATIARNQHRGRALTRALPWLMLAPSLLITFAVLIYPIWNGLRASLMSYRYGKAVAFVGLDNYTRLLSDPQFLNSLWVTLKFVDARRLAGNPAGPFARAVLSARVSRHPTVAHRPHHSDGDHARRGGDRVPPDLRQRRWHVHRHFPRVRRRQRPNPQRPAQRLFGPCSARCVGMDPAHVPDPAGRPAEPAAGAARSRARRRRRRMAGAVASHPADAQTGYRHRRHPEDDRRLRHISTKCS